MSTTDKRFRIAFSFAGEKRDFVEKVARILADCFGEEAILYDKFHEAELARFDLGIYLPKLYSENCELIVPVLCPHYDVKRWTGWEWIHIYGLLTNADGRRVMPSRFDYAQADGLAPTAGFIELDDKSPVETAKLILERLALNEDKPRDYYVQRLHAQLNTRDHRTAAGDGGARGERHFASQEESPKKLSEDVSPFYTATSMSPDEPSYVTREFDRTFKALLHDPRRPCIAFIGESETGKTSLMNRASQFLDPAWTVVSISLSDLRADKVENCVDRFLAFFSHAFGDLNSLPELGKRVKKTPTLVVIDEFATMAGPGAKVLLPQLMNQVRDSSGRLRVVVTLITGFDVILNECGVNRGEHLRLWKTITMKWFNEAEAKRLLALLPESVWVVADGLFDEIQRHSELKPRKLQFVADRLWHAYRDGAEEVKLAAIISNVDSYHDS